MLIALKQAISDWDVPMPLFIRYHGLTPEELVRRWYSESDPLRAAEPTRLMFQRLHAGYSVEEVFGGRK